MLQIPLTIFTTKYNQLICITDQVCETVKKSGIQNGTVTVLTKHTTTGIMINEALECIEDDILDFLVKLVPEDYPYIHNRMLHSYGSTAGNPAGHIKSLLTGTHCHFAVESGQIIRGEAQNIYFCEFDGPSERTILLLLEGG
jgi:secondary thiamine-phosphate synthase enzyme